MDEIELSHKILTENFNYNFVEEYSSGGSDVNIFEYNKPNKVGNYRFYANIKSNKITLLTIDPNDTERFNQLKIQIEREESLNDLLNE
jgi:hypothetical protein